MSACENKAFGFDRYDKGRLQKALKEVSDKCTSLRLKAVLLFVQGMDIQSVAKLFDKSIQSVYRWIRLYSTNHRSSDLLNAPRSGRPVCAQEITDKRILSELRRNALHLGYNTIVWTVALLAQHLNSRYGSSKRPHYVYSEKEPAPGTKKGGLSYES
ncbi:MAG: helix-turn-helix domain-containing protein [Bacteroidota bacterium]|nr:helix-turn-helix domain-containing protein [Flavisolibacter sp.]MBD0377771.1 helix-turn-helix domain-containing protein [Flavisolibacter sp.]MDQ3844490.1 helix-turn-helix domain-containing protein [Bacteroidota bacterium]